MDDKEVVSAIRATLADKVGQDRFDLVARRRMPAVAARRELLVELPNRFSQDWVRSHFRREIEAACAETLGKPLAVEFRVDRIAGALRGRTENGRRGRQHGVATGETPPKSSSRQRTRQRALPIASAAACCGNAAIGRRTIAARRYEPASIGMNGTSPASIARKFSTLEGFVVGASNRLAHASAQMVAEQPGRLSPLLVYGPTGVGKTHLLEGIWSARRDEAVRDIHAVYLSAEQFTTYFLEALHGSGLPSFRRKYRGVELLIIDGLQFFAGKRATVERTAAHDRHAAARRAAIGVRRRSRRGRLARLGRRACRPGFRRA